MIKKTTKYDKETTGTTYTGTWSGLGTSNPATLTEANAAGASFQWTGSGSLYKGINFRKDDDSGIAQVVITNDTESTTLYSGVVDLYTIDFDATNNVYEDFVLWSNELQEEDTYTIDVRHRGDHNPNAVGSDYHIQIDSLIDKVNLSYSINSTLTTWDSDYPSDTHTYTLVKDDVIDLEKQQSFSADGVDTEFTLSGSNRASEFLFISKDNGVTWLYPHDVSLTWGNNSPDYDNDTIGSDGYFTAKFESAPASGNTIIIRYKPLIDKFKINTTINQPTDGSNYTDLRTPIRILDHSLEMIP